MQAYLISSSFILVFQGRVSLHLEERETLPIPGGARGGGRGGDIEEEENLISESLVTNPRDTNPSGTNPLGTNPIG